MALLKTVSYAYIKTNLEVKEQLKMAAIFYIYLLKYFLTDIGDIGEYCFV